MTALTARLRTDLTAAMRAKNALVVSTLRMVLSAVQVEEVAGPTARELTEEEVLRVVAKEAKKRAEAAEAFAGAGRAELAAKERAEGDVLAAYLPTPLSDAEVVALAGAAVAQVAAETGSPPGLRQMGLVMKIAGSAAAGRADGSRISAAVKAHLQG